MYSMKRKEMKLELFTVSDNHEFGERITIEKVGNWKEFAKIKGKSLFRSVFEDNKDPEQKKGCIICPFKFNFDLPFDVEVELKSGKKRLLNTELICTEHIHNRDVETKFYTYLNYWKRLILKGGRNQLWIQQASNIMWFVNIIVASMAVYATYITAKEKIDQKTIYPRYKVEQTQPK